MDKNEVPRAKGRGFLERNTERPRFIRTLKDAVLWPRMYKAYASLKKFSQGLGLDIFGVAGIQGVKKDFLIAPEVLAGVDKAVCLGLGLSRGILAELKSAPTRLYFYHYKTVNAFLDQAALKVSSYIQKKGFLAIPIPASQIVDWQNQKAHLSHKKIARLAGLGWIGRSNLLVNKKLGSQFRLVSILTDMPLKTDKPAQDGCGFCRACLEACPAGAIQERVEDFNYQLCFEKLKEFQKTRLADQYICGVCVRACKPR